MNNKPIWLTKRFILTLHSMMVDKFGGIDGIRDEALLESAIAKPQNYFAYGEQDIYTLAAAYATGIIKNHPFLDGNKRTGFMAATVFLDTNNKQFIADEASATQMTLALASGKIDQKVYSQWLRDNC